jgi:hypothetical protein
MGNALGIGTLKPKGKMKTRKEGLMSFIREKLIDFSVLAVDQFADKDEKLITESLVQFLQDHALGQERSFQFVHQTSDGPKRQHSNDFQCRSCQKGQSTIIPLLDPSQNAILRFEAKRLTEGLGKGREKEYVIGPKNGGGIERFKKGVHGGRDQAAAMIGYIQRYDAAHWHPKVNAWIDEQIAQSVDQDLTWNEQDRLQLQGTFSQVTEFNSTSARMQGTPISLSHFWLQLA